VSGAPDRRGYHDPRVGRGFAGKLWRLVVVAAVSVAAVGASSALPARSAAPRVTIFGDSAAEVLDYVSDAKQYLAQGLDVNWQLRVCRRLVQLSCPYQGVRPPTVLDVVHAAANGSLGSIVVVDVGYNDYVDQYQDDMETVLKALVAKGVEHVIWTTMHEVRQDYRAINASIRAEAARWPQVVVADWNAASQGQNWFNSDGIHLNSSGAWGLVRLLRPVVLSACGDPCQPPPAKTASGPYVIRAGVTSIQVGPYALLKGTHRGTYAQATAAFGPATTCRLLPGRKSRATWSSVGVAMQFIVARGSVCSPSTAMVVQTVTVAGSRWKTSNGLAVGDPVAKLQRLYPAATALAGGYRLLKTDQGSDHAQLTAAVRGGSVTGFSLAVRTGS
jgi:hypothetical protein